MRSARTRHFSIFVEQGSHCFLPATALFQCDGPLNDGIQVVFASQHNRRCTMYQQGATVAIGLLWTVRRQLDIPVLSFKDRKQSMNAQGFVPEFKEETASNRARLFDG